MADRYCGNCGQELGSDNRFCPGCGQQLHETAIVPTPEAGVPVPPIQQEPGSDTAATTKTRGKLSGRGWALIVLPVLWVVSIAADAPPGLTGILGFGFFIVLLAPVVRRVFRGNPVQRPDPNAGTFDASPDEILSGLMAHMTSRGYSLDSGFGTTVKFSYRVPPNPITGLLLLLLGIIPGVLYFLLAGSSMHCGATAFSTGEGTRVTVNGPDIEGMREITRYLDGVRGAKPH